MEGSGEERKRVVYPVLVMREGRVVYEEREERPGKEEYGWVRPFVPLVGEWDEWGRK